MIGKQQTRTTNSPLDGAYNKVNDTLKAGGEQGFGSAPVAAVALINEYLRLAKGREVTEEQRSYLSSLYERVMLGQSNPSNKAEAARNEAEEEWLGAVQELTGIMPLTYGVLKAALEGDIEHAATHCGGLEAYHVSAAGALLDTTRVLLPGDNSDVVVITNNSAADKPPELNVRTRPSTEYNGFTDGVRVVLNSLVVVGKNTGLESY